jgi:hypothetical protein
MSSDSSDSSSSSSDSEDEVIDELQIADEETVTKEENRELASGIVVGEGEDQELVEISLTTSPELDPEAFDLVPSPTSAELQLDDISGLGSSEQRAVGINEERMEEANEVEPMNTEQGQTEEQQSTMKAGQAEPVIISKSEKGQELGAGSQTAVDSEQGRGDGNTKHHKKNEDNENETQEEIGEDELDYEDVDDDDGRNLKRPQEDAPLACQEDASLLLDENCTLYEAIPSDPQRPRRIRLKRVIQHTQHMPSTEASPGNQTSPKPTKTQNLTVISILKPTLSRTLSRAISVSATPRQQYTKFPPQIMKHLLLLKSKTPVAWDPKAFAQDYRQVMEKLHWGNKGNSNSCNNLGGSSASSTRKRDLLPSNDDSSSSSSNSVSRERGGERTKGSNGGSSKRAKTEEPPLKRTMYSSMSKEEKDKLKNKCHADGKQLKKLAERMPDIKEKGKYLLYSALKFLEEAHITQLTQSAEAAAHLFKQTAIFFQCVADLWEREHKGLFACCKLCAALCYYTSFKLQRGKLSRGFDDLKRMAKTEKDTKAPALIRSFNVFAVGTEDLFEAYKCSDKAEESNQDFLRKADLSQADHFITLEVPAMISHVNDYIDSAGL